MLSLPSPEPQHLLRKPPHCCQLYHHHQQQQQKQVLSRLEALLLPCGPLRVAQTY
jgi:hypothetical protein